MEQADQADQADQVEDPYVLEGPRLDTFEENFELIQTLLENQVDTNTLVFDLEWLPSPVFKSLFLKLAEGEPIGEKNGDRLKLFRPYTRDDIEGFLTYMGYGDRGQGTQYLNKRKATPAQARESYDKARLAMFEKFKRDFTDNYPSAKPRFIRTRKYTEEVNEEPSNDELNEPRKESVYAPIRINNNEPTFGKLSGKKSLKYRRRLATRNTRKR